MSAARILNQFYIPTRYPVAPIGSTSKGMPSKDIAEEALSIANNILDFFLNRERFVNKKRKVKEEEFER
ncbi:MAG: hypothetical protein APF76_04545 [Desulfitibacter sp. BRH_c19]|nr:MAG: hypothetical protein APF76_04545 [Desulfitibacter sp. BRH_c19]